LPRIWTAGDRFDLASREQGAGAPPPTIVFTSAMVLSDDEIRAALGRPGSRAGEEPLRLGVSSCLLGEEVRFDGGHKRDRTVTDLLGAIVSWVSVCPEVEVGMGVPRPALRLVRDGDSLRMEEIASGRDHTRRMESFAARRVRALRDLDLCGYVLKSRSPSCGIGGVEVHGEDGSPRRDGRGLYASALLAAYPELPVEEGERLHDARLRENFVERLYAYRRRREGALAKPSTRDAARSRT
jgi:uncharacterized protein YbbK (DUF523 family)